MTLTTGAVVVLALIGIGCYLWLRKRGSVAAPPAEITTQIQHEASVQQEVRDRLEQPPTNLPPPELEAFFNRPTESSQ